MKEPHTSASAIAAVVLAAGMSTRFGQRNKLLHEIDGITILARALGPLQVLDLKEIVVVLGCDHEAIGASLPVDGIRRFVATDFADGLGHSIRAGIASLSNGTAGTFIVLADMPWIPVEVYQALLKALGGNVGADAFVPVYEGCWGNPVLFRSSAFPELLNLTGDRGARSLLRDGTLSAIEVQCDTSGILSDIDFPQDVEHGN